MKNVKGEINIVFHNKNGDMKKYPIMRYISCFLVADFVNFKNNYINNSIKSFSYLSHIEYFQRLLHILAPNSRIRSVL